jgi:hypothetical protein
VTFRAALALLLATVAACGGGAADSSAVPASPVRPAAAARQGRPPVAAVIREGDARGAIAVAVTTAGIAPERGATVGVALAALVEARLAERGIADVRAVGGWDGWRLRALAGTPAEAARIATAVQATMLAPVQADEAAMAAVASRVAALAQRPLVDDALVDAARCTGEPYGTGRETPPSAAEVQSWLRAAHGLGRVVFATAGDAGIAEGAGSALAQGPDWPTAAPIVEQAWPATDPQALVYDASGEVAPGAARIVLTAWTAVPERAVAAATALGDPRGPLVSRLAALSPPARLRSVVATSHPGGGCVATTIDLDARGLAADAPARIATAAGLVRQEVAVDIADTTVPPNLRDALAARAPDPREAAERVAWWSLATVRARVAPDDVRLGLAVGAAAARDSANSDVAGAEDQIRGALDRATFAWRSPVVESRTLVERGQAELWILVASPCGTLAEANGDAGAGAAIATAAALASRDAGDARVDPFVAADGVGVLAHGPARPGESPLRQARRIADLAARSFVADSLGADALGEARTLLVGRSSDRGARALATLGSALAPGHPSWVDPRGTSFGLGSSTEEALRERLAALRAGPLRVAVLANADVVQADAAVRAVDRWVVRRPGDTRVCPTTPAPAQARPGTYAVELAGSTSSEALLAFPLSVDASTRAAASWMAAALDGQGGLLERALGSADGAPPLATESSAVVLGAPRAPALVVRLVAPDTSLDAAVAQVRALLNRLRQGALKPEDRARAASLLERAALSAKLDPRARAVQLWRSEAPEAGPSLDDLLAFAAGVLRDEALVVVAARPPRSPSPPFPRARPPAKSRDQGSSP